MSISKLISEIKNKKNLSPEIRFYFIEKNKHYFLNEGILKNGFNSKLIIKKIGIVFYLHFQKWHFCLMKLLD